MKLNLVQPGILNENTPLARYLSFSIYSKADVKDVLKELTDFINIENTVIGLGYSLVDALGQSITGLSIMPARSADGVEIPSTPAALWCWLKGNDRGELFHRSLEIEKLLAPAFVINDVIDSFQYEQNRDLSGYEDGTENPQGDDAIEAAIVQGCGAGIDGSSFVAVQQWHHDFEKLKSMTTKQRDDVIGRHIRDNEEFEEAPESAHVKRSAQESFEPEAFMLRRSMPWSDGMEAGLVFVAFGKSFQAF